MIVYIYTFPNGKKYVGQTTMTVAQRAQRGRGYSRCPYVYAAIQKYGWDSIEIETIECNSEEEMDELEKELITKYKTTDREFGYNLDSGGHFQKQRSEETKQKLREYRTGLKASEETKAKMREAHKGQIGPWTGKTLSEEHKKHIGEGVKGEKNGMYGKNHTEEAKQKMSEARGTKVICLETKEIYPSAQAASKAIGLSISAVGQVICGKAKTSGGFHWMKLDDYEKLYGEVDNGRNSD